MAENLNKIWAGSVPLSEFFEPWLHLAEASILPLEQLDEADDVVDPTLRSLNTLVRNLAVNTRQNKVRENAILELRNELVSGETAVLGRYTADGANFRIVEIPSDFWIGAKISPENNAAELAKTKFDQLRILSQRDPEDTAGNKGNRETEKYRREAIASCEYSGLVDLSGGPKSRRTKSNNISVRTEIYLAFLRHKYPKQEFEHWGFSEKSFERSETQHKKSKAERLKRG